MKRITFRFKDDEIYFDFMDKARRENLSFQKFVEQAIKNYLNKGENKMKINENGVEVRQDRDESTDASGSYYHCEKCGYDNVDIKDVAEEVCWGCGKGDYLELRNFVE